MFGWDAVTGGATMTEQLMYAEINVVNIVIMGIIALRALGSVYGKRRAGVYLLRRLFLRQ